MAVYTHVTSEELETFVEAYDIGHVVSAKGIAEGVENSNYLLGTDKGRHILTLYEKRVAERDLPFFLGLMEHLAAKGFPCPVPIRARDCAAVRLLKGRPAAIISFLEGLSASAPTTEHCGELGRVMAEMHAAGTDFPLFRTNSLGKPSWRPFFETIAARVDEIEAGLGSATFADLDAIDAGWPEDLPTGIIHADLFPDNVFFLDGRLSGVIDFYFACNDLLAFDLAVSLNAWCFDGKGGFLADRAHAMIAGYESVRPLTDEEVAGFPVLCRGAAVRFLLTRMHDWIHHDYDALVLRKDPRDFSRRLAFHRAAGSAADYGLERSR